MARFETTITPQQQTEGQGDFTVTISLVQEDNDPPFTEVTQPARIIFFVSGLAGNPNDLSGDLSGALSFSGYGSQTTTFSPIADGVSEIDESFIVGIAPVSPLLTDSGEITTLIPNLLTGTIIDECFLAGTKISTKSGYLPVEELKIRDKVRTFDGKTEEVKWIGKQTRHRLTSHPTRSLPIQIKVGALGDGLPTNLTFHDIFWRVNKSRNNIYQ